MFTIVVTGRNDDYGGGFLDRLLGTARVNAGALRGRGIAFEYLLVEWNPVAGRALAAASLVRELQEARAIVVGPELHAAYSLNPAMTFHEMAAKNVGIRHARGEAIVVTNADVILGSEVIDWMESAHLDGQTLYRAARIDVVPDCPMTELADRRHHLRSGEGIRPTCSYLGAGGDFCAATHDLWHALGGFDERTRFTTRAKDWQFFLSGRAQGVAVEYVGTVYHLDHGEGFRNTPEAVRAGGSAHFGAAWDFELELPIRPPDQWGLADGRFREDPRLPRVLHVEAPAALMRWRAAEAQDARKWAWIRGGLHASPVESGTRINGRVEAGSHDPTRAVLTHAIAAAAAARQPLVIEPRTPRAAAAAWGLAGIAKAKDVDLCVRWTWPAWCDVPDRGVIDAPLAGRAQAWTAVVDDDGVDVLDAQTRKVDVLPHRMPPSSPEFNPLLARRLLRAWIQMLRAGWRRIAIYGAGSHTRSLLGMGVPDWLDVVAVVVSAEPPRQRDGTGRAEFGGGGPFATAGSGTRQIPVRYIGDLARDAVDGLLLSSVTYEADMRATADRYHLTALPLYADDAAEALEIGRSRSKGAA